MWDYKGGSFAVLRIREAELLTLDDFMIKILTDHIIFYRFPWGTFRITFIIKRHKGENYADDRVWTV